MYIKLPVPQLRIDRGHCREVRRGQPTSCCRMQPKHKSLGLEGAATRALRGCPHLPGLTACGGSAGAAERHVRVQHGAAQHDAGQGRVHDGVCAPRARHRRPPGRAVRRVPANQEQQGVSALRGSLPYASLWSWCCAGWSARACVSSHSRGCFGGVYLFGRVQCATSWSGSLKYESLQDPQPLPKNECMNELQPGLTAWRHWWNA